MKKPTPPSDLWAQMDAILGAPEEEMEGISIGEYAQRHRLSDKTARRYLDRAVQEGKLIQGKRKARNNNWERVFRPK